MKTRILLCAAWFVAGIGFPARRARAGGKDWSWMEPHAKVKATGDLEWKPKPFRFEAGPSVRYIDYGRGDDGNDGTSRRSPWKHHPWDPSAAGKAAACSGIHTYVFKRGVVYRGVLKAGESGRPGDPIRLTSDPSWGGREGTRSEAVICGSETVRGWKRGADHKDIPEPGKVWYADLDFAPRNVWLIGRGGKITRIPLARTPNWKVSDPDDVKSEWWHWNYPTGKRVGRLTDGPRGGKLHLGIDTEHLVKPAEYYEKALVWTEYVWVMGTPYPTYVEAVDTKNRGLGFLGQWGGVGAYKIAKWNRYYLEDKPHYLDDPDGEFWFDKKGEGGRLYIRVPGAKDPNSAHIEAARISTLVDSTRLNHVSFTGLTFRFTNVYWDLTAAMYESGGFKLKKHVHPACIRLMGRGKDIRVSHCLFEHVNIPILIRAWDKGEDIDQVVVTDNEIRCTDHGGIYILEGAHWRHVLPEKGFLYNVRVLRNKLHKIGVRPNRYGQGEAIDVANAQTAEIAGNILSRCWGIGINIRGAKNSWFTRDCPLSRVIVHHNKVVDSLLNCNDYGGIETWQGGPFYVYNNISGNPGGYRHCNFMLGKDTPGSARHGPAFYLDGSFKNYLFNNIAWGRSKDPFSRLGNSTAFNGIHSYQNTFFNNTVYNFVKGSHRPRGPHAGRYKYLGNIWHSIGDWVCFDSFPAKTRKEGNEKETGAQKTHYALETNAYAQNIFYDITGKYGSFEPSGRWHESLDSLQKALDEKSAIRSGVGEIAETVPLRDALNHDFRLAKGSRAIDMGVKVFVPWGLYAMVGEWNFYSAGDDPTRIMDEHWYMTPYYFDRQDYGKKPMFPLIGANIESDDYVEGPLEDWVKGALKLDGKSQYAVCSNDKLNGPLDYEVQFRKRGKKKEKWTATGDDFKSPQVYISNSLLEVYFKTEAGHTKGVLVEKMSGNGYSLSIDTRGRVAFEVKGAGGSGAVTSRARVNDGGWHHVIAEADRKARTLTLYVDGRKDATGAGVGADVSLANSGDLHVGGTPRGRCLAGSLDFLRIALGTLADAKTDIDELYAWQFDGPFLRDFTGRRPAGAGRDAGAIESTR